MKKICHIIAMVAIFATVVLFGGCKTTTKIEKEYIHDTIIRTDIRVDSVDRWHTHYEYLLGDTIKVVDSVYLYKYIRTTDTLVKTEVEYRDNNIETVKEVRKVVWWPLWVALGIVAAIFFAYRIGNWLDYQERKDEEDIE